MKYILKNLKYLVFTLTFVIVGFAFSSPANASSYSYSCSDGGTIVSTVDISPAGPFSSGSTTSFDVSASMQSFSCATRKVNLTAQNNSGATHIIIPDQTLNQDGFIPPVIDSINFAAPSSAGTYAVHFITGVDENNIFFVNNSLGVAIGNIKFNEVKVNPFPGYSLYREFYHAVDTKVDVSVEWTNEFGGTPGETIVVTDSYGNTQCTTVEEGDPDPTWVFYDVDTSGPGIYSVMVEASNNSSC